MEDAMDEPVSSTWGRRFSRICVVCAYGIRSRDQDYCHAAAGCREQLKWLEVRRSGQADFGRVYSQGLSALPSSFLVLPFEDHLGRS